MTIVIHFIGAAHRAVEPDLFLPRGIVIFVDTVL